MKNSIKKKIFVFFTLAVLALIVSKIILLSYSRPKKYEVNLLSLGTVVSIVCYSESQVDFDAVTRLCSEKMKNLERIFSIHMEDSELNLLNHSAPKEPFHLSASLKKVIGVSKDLWYETDGAFDPSVYPLVRLWKLSDFEVMKMEKLPEKEKISEIMKRLGMDKVELREDGFVQFKNDMVSLDLGGIAKGYIIDELISVLMVEKKIFAGIVNVGGDLKAFSRKADFPPFKIGIRDPLEKDSILGYVNLRNGCVMTSGGYERFKEFNEKKYIHIIDPKTGRPVDNGVLSVTVIGSDAMRCDALSTACMVMGLKRSQDIVFEEKVFFVVEREGKTDKIFLNGFELIE